MAQSYPNLGGHLHSIAVEDEHLVRTTEFDWDEVSRIVDGEEPEERTITMADASAAVSILLGWICGTQKDEPLSIASVGARAESLLLLLDSNQSRYKSLADIARAAGLSRASLSKSLLSLKDQSGLALTIGKLHGTRETYREVQRKCMTEGKHASFSRRDSRSNMRAA